MAHTTRTVVTRPIPFTLDALAHEPEAFGRLCLLASASALRLLHSLPSALTSSCTLHPARGARVADAAASATHMEGMSAPDQLRTWMDGPNLLVVPHGAGSTHASYLPPCSVVLEVMPNMYPQFSFLVPTLRSGGFMLYLLEASAIGNPQLSCHNSSSTNLKKMARGDPVSTPASTARSVPCW